MAVKNKKKKGIRRQKSRTSAKTVAMAIVLLVLVAAIAGVSYFVTSVLTSQVTYDEETLCPTTGPNGAMAVLLDLTDPISATQAQRLETMLAQEIESLPPQTMISLGVVSTDPENWGARFARCKPETGENASVLYQNPRLIAERFQSGFQTPLQTAIRELLSVDAEENSPIIEGLQALLIETPHFDDTEASRSIIVVSDLLQNSPILSFFQGQSWDDFVQSGSTDRLAGNLDDVSVTLIRVPRPSVSQTTQDQVEPFWARYLDRQGANAPIKVMVLGDL